MKMVLCFADKCQTIAVMGPSLVLDKGGPQICKHYYRAAEVHKNMRS